MANKKRSAKSRCLEWFSNQYGQEISDECERRLSPRATEKDCIDMLNIVWRERQSSSSHEDGPFTSVPPKVKYYPSRRTFRTT